MKIAFDQVIDWNRRFELKKTINEFNINYLLSSNFLALSVARTSNWIVGSFSRSSETVVYNHPVLLSIRNFLE